jgi:hypothetical protein
MNPPRNWATGAFRFVLVTLLTFVVLVGSAVSMASLAAWLYDSDWNSPSALVTGFVCGLVVWLFIAVFHLRRETIVWPCLARDAFIAKAKAVLGEMGYSLTTPDTDSLTFRPGFHSYLFGGAIEISLADHEVRLTGPRVSLELFRRYFRVANHLHGVHERLADQRKVPETRLKRVEMQLRVDPDQLESVRANVLALLEKEGALICELNVMLQSDKGVRESLIEIQLRDWLEQNGIDAEIRKNHVQFAEAVPASNAAVGSHA